VLNIKNLEASIDNKQILKDLNLVIKPGEVHAIMGPNGSGKSTLANVLSGKNGYEILIIMARISVNFLQKKEHKKVYF